jgi:hypothetical protein
MRPPAEFTFRLDAPPANVFAAVWRTDLDAPGFAVLVPETSIESRLSRRLIVDLATAFAEFSSDFAPADVTFASPLRSTSMRFPAFAVLLAAFSSHALADDKTAAEALKDAKVEVKFDKTGGAVGVFCKESHLLTTEHFKLIGSLKGLKELTLYNKCPLDDANLALIADLPSLEKVGIDGATFSDSGMKHMAGWKSLKTMTFFHQLNKKEFTGGGLTHLKDLPHFESFGCGGSPFTDAGMAAAAKLPHLKDLRVWHTMNTDAGTAKLKDAANLRSVWLAPQFTPRITDESLAKLADVPTLEEVKITETKLTWDGGLRHLKALPKLKKLNLDETDVSDADLTKLKDELPNVEVARKPPTEEQKKWLTQRFAAKK